MKDSPENFERLQKLLALKKHEQPPPGFYDGLAGKIMTRVRSGAPAPEENWLFQLWISLVNRPAVSGTLAATIVGLFLVLFLQTGKIPVPSQSEQNAQLPWLNDGIGEPVKAANSKSMFNPIRDDPSIARVSTNSTDLQSNPPSLFMQFPIQTERVGFTN
jgi:hypothetical protein